MILLKLGILIITFGFMLFIRIYSRPNWVIMKDDEAQFELTFKDIAEYGVYIRKQFWPNSKWSMERIKYRLYFLWRIK